jgi:hypothetical protein
MGTEPTGSMPEGMQSNGPPTEAPSIPTRDHGEGERAQERVHAVAGNAAGEAKELARQDPGDNEPPEWAIEAAKGELRDDASTEEIRTRAVEMVKEEQGA